jgi:hypothetical protein
MDYDYLPDRWVVIKIITPKECLYKVFATWMGSYGRSDSWRMNSGITSARLVNAHWEFVGDSGSVYGCGESRYGTSGWSSNILKTFIDQAPVENATIEIMPETTDWATVPYDRLQQFITDGVK